MSPRRRGCICVFAKPPRAGQAKTRLATAVGGETAADLARAFLADTWRTASRAAWADAVLAATDPAAPELAALPADRVWDQGPGTLGDRMERVARRALASDPFVILIGADLPGLPMSRLDAARAALEHADAVLGPADDGGFYLVGLNACPPGLFDDLPWSASDTFARTLDRFRAERLDPAVIDGWFDIDRPGDIERLVGLVRSGVIDAPETSRLLRERFGTAAGGREAIRRD